jgi:purine-nucleoside phosphorylase
MATELIYENLHEAVAFIRTKTQLKPRVGIILGSGMGSVAEVVRPEVTLDYSAIPFFAQTSVEGHKGRLILGHINEVPVALMQGRLHLYEGYSMAQVVFPTRVLAMLGIEALIVTNAAGGLSKKMKAGDLMAIYDHINLMGDNPLKGKNIDQLGPRFPDMTEAYDLKFFEAALSVGKKIDLTVRSGVYVGVMGPTYETPAEVRHLQIIGGHAVGMSTVPEVIAANHFGIRVCGISCITNLAAGISKHKLSHQEVTDVAKRIEVQFKKFLVELTNQISGALNEPRR